jgi:hypothetical protein
MTATLQPLSDSSRDTWTEAGGEHLNPAGNAEIGIAEGAAILHVSREFFTELLEAGKIPSRKASGQFRVLLADVRGYRANLRVKQEAIMTKLAAESQAVEGE